MDQNRAKRSMALRSVGTMGAVWLGISLLGCSTGPSTVAKARGAVQPVVNSESIKPSIVPIPSKPGWRDALLGVKGLDPRIAVLQFYQRQDRVDDVLLVVSSQGSTFPIYRLVFLRRKGDKAALISRGILFRPRLGAKFRVEGSDGKVFVVADLYRRKGIDSVNRVYRWPENSSL